MAPCRSATATAGVGDIIGAGGADTLGGADGNDALFGGTGGDHFLFAKGDGIDTIRDFEDGIDAIYISGFAAIGSFAQLKPFIETHGDDI